MPSVSESARIAQIHYIYQQRPNKERADKYAKRKLGRIGYELDSFNTDKDVLTAKRGDNIHINYTGTDVNNPRDILSDVALSVGLQSKNKQFSDRRKKTREIMRKYGDDKDYSLGGHSLGGSIALNTMKESKSIRDRVKTVHAFNPGYTKPFHDSLKVDKETKKELNKKINIHRVKNDIVSAHANKETAFGNLFEYKHADKDSDLFEKHNLETFANVDM
jgi:dienelactone hydrolase